MARQRYGNAGSLGKKLLKVVCHCRNLYLLAIGSFAEFNLIGTGKQSVKVKASSTRCVLPAFGSHKSLGPQKTKSTAR